MPRQTISLSLIFMLLVASFLPGVSVRQAEAVEEWLIEATSAPGQPSPADLLATANGASSIFSTRRLDPVPAEIQHTLMADLNADGRLDMVVSGRTQSMVYRNNDRGNLILWATLNTTIVAVGDVNRDGSLDLAGGTAVFFGDGQGNFVTGPTVPTTIFALGDLDGDTLLDIVGQGVVYLNRGAAGFVAGATFGSRPDKLMAVALGDMNNDGYLDIVAGNSAQNTPLGCLPAPSNDCFGESSAVYLNEGRATFQPGKPFGNGFGDEAVQALALGDFDGDGYLDIVTGNTPYWYPIITGSEMIGG